MHLKTISLYLLIALYILAGINHFWHPAFYIPVIPPYFHSPEFINKLAGVCEIVLGLMMMFAVTRRAGAIGIVLMLIVFITAHVYFLKMHPCNNGSCKMFWIGWIRLFIIQPILIVWAWRCRK